MTLFKVKTERVTQIIIIFLYLTIIETNAGISCFKCFVPRSGADETDFLCSQFDGSARFQVYCPTSTLCRKRTVYYRTQTSVTTAVERDCAPQKIINPTYSTVDNKWHNEEEIVETAYEENCFLGEDRTGSGPSEYCFCSFNLCNSSPSIGFTNIYLVYLLLTLLPCVFS